MTSVSLSATVRASVSLGPPGASGTIRRIGLDGYDCADTAETDKKKTETAIAVLPITHHPSLVGTGSRLPDRLAHLFHLDRQVGRELLLRRAQRLGAQAGKPLLELRCLQYLYQLGIELRQDSRRRFCRRDQAVPAYEFVARNRLRDSWHLRNEVGALGAGDAERPEFHGPDRGQHGRDNGNQELHLPRHRVDHRRGDSLVRNM